MWYVKHSLSRRRVSTERRYFGLGLVAVLAVALPSITTFGALIATNHYIVRSHDVVVEDQYVTATSVQIEGLVDADMTIFTGSLIITGEVTGTVTVFTSGTVTIAEGGSIGGSLQGVAASVHVSGAIGGDVFVGAAPIVVDSTGVVGGDLMAFGGMLTVTGEVGGDVLGYMLRTTVSGSIGRDLDIATQSLDIEAPAVIGGDVLYRSPADAEIDPDAEIAGTITHLPTQGNFLFGVILTLANVVTFMGFLVAGLIALWMFRTSSSRAVGRMLTRPIRTLLVGLATVIAGPVVIVLLAMTLVGLPLAVIGVMFAGIAFIIGPVPAVTALGNRILFNRGGLLGAFVVGAVVWRLAIWLIPAVGGIIYLIALVWGIGAWVTGFAATRRGDPMPPVLVPASIVVKEEIPQEWTPPLAPRRDEPLPPPEESDAPSDDTETPIVPPEETDDWGLPLR